MYYGLLVNPNIFPDGWIVRIGPDLAAPYLQKTSKVPFFTCKKRKKCRFLLVKNVKIDDNGKMQRQIFTELREWKNDKNRKPLILKGVRQTGKTFILKKFGELDFPQFHYINFEENQKAADLFKDDLNPVRIINDLSFFLDTAIDVKRDLIIFDEIQACPAALTSLKYFSEQLRELALCCAGSLLGLHLNESSFPVGKVDFLYMRPMSFFEFLEANKDSKSLDYLNQCKFNDRITPIIHDHLWNQLKIYFVTGGLPEVVYSYLQTKEDLYTSLNFVRKKQNELIYGYYADIAKHSGKVNAMYIDRVWRDIPSQLAQSQEGTAKRFQFKGIIPGIDRYQRLANVIDWLSAAELIIKVPIIEHVELPLKAYTEENHFKLYLFDVGILGALADLPPQAILDYTYGTYKGYFAENFLAQEFMAKGITNLYSWQINRAEVEFLYLIKNHIIPIEVKSGWVTRNQSLKKYAEKYHPPFEVLFSAKPLLIDVEQQIHQYPLYMAYWFPLKSPD